ncbi:hypothetical protein DFH08DRAFT_805442 [Mycena albidolilacea]|uniref:Uncharacterized protein n=1 Tax=Mycena albidolilacea TaxID=1033008 RepID=A0AAD7A8I2_9AGAR|nr:hypothetical protein DFH08DRAFT_805442 [Mycena albidolilacea]
MTAHDTISELLDIQDDVAPLMDSSDNRLQAQRAPFKFRNRTSEPSNARSVDQLKLSHSADVWRKVGHNGVVTTRLYAGDSARQVWTKDLEMFAANLGHRANLRLELNQSDTELVPIDIYARSIDSPMRNVDFELALIQNFAVSASNFATYFCCWNTDHTEGSAIQDIFEAGRRTSGGYKNPREYGDMANIKATEWTDRGVTRGRNDAENMSVFSYHATVIGVINAEYRETVADLALISTSMRSLSRTCRLSVKGENLENLKLRSIYLERLGEPEVLHPIAELKVPNAEMIIEVWATRKGVSEHFPRGWTRTHMVRRFRFEVELKTDCSEPGYFLSLYGSVYMPVAEYERQRAGWLLQAHSILQRSDVFQRGWSHEDMVIGTVLNSAAIQVGTDPFAAEFFFVNLDWQLVPEQGTSNFPELPQKLCLRGEHSRG